MEGACIGRPIAEADDNDLLRLAQLRRQTQADGDRQARADNPGREHHAVFRPGHMHAAALAGSCHPELPTISPTTCRIGMPLATCS